MNDESDYLMPGIFGCLNRNGDIVSERLAIEIANCMKHEDWYVVEHISNPCILGIVELDFLHCGNSLIYDNGGSLVGVSKGNIYNKKELSVKFGVESAPSSSNDTRFIVELYEKEGLDFAKHLNGLFVAAIYDKEKDRIIVANDRYGYYPMFYSLSPKNFIFASEVKAILKDKTIIPKIDKIAIPQFFAFSFILGEKTFVEDVKSMPPSCILTYDRVKDRIDVRRYWDFTLKKHDQTRPLGAYLKEFNKLMNQAVERRVKDHAKVGIFLSGGLDSRIIAAFASQTKTQIVTFTFGIKNCEEQEIASEVSERLGIENIFYEIPSDFIANYAEKIVYRGDGLIRVRDCHFIAFLDEIRRRVQTVLLGTFGGDLSCRPEGRLSEKFVNLRKREEVIKHLMEYYTSVVNNGVLPFRQHSRAFTDAFFREVVGKAETNFIRTFKEIRFNSPSDIGDYWEYRNREPRYIFRASQHINWYLETRHPFMDNDLVDFFAFRFPPELRRREVFGITFEDTFLQKSLSQSFPSLSDIPWHGIPPNSSILRVIIVQGSRFIRKRCANMLERLLRKKVTLTPIDFRGYAEWLRTDSKRYMLDLLLDEKTLQRPYIRRDFIRKVIDDHLNYRKNHDQLICDLINFELMNRIFFETIEV